MNRIGQVGIEQETRRLEAEQASEVWSEECQEMQRSNVIPSLATW